MLFTFIKNETKTFLNLRDHRSSLKTCSLQNIFELPPEKGEGQSSYPKEQNLPFLFGKNHQLSSFPFAFNFSKN